MKYSKLLRIWHWLNAITILGLLATFFLRKTFLSWRTNSQLIVDKFELEDIEVTTELAKATAKAIRAPMWEWHIIFGYILAGLIIFRIIIFIKEGVSYKDFSSLHRKGITALYTVFYILVTFMTISGLVIYFGADLELSKDFRGSLKDIHEYVAWFFVFFVPLHMGGVLVAELTDEKGLVSKMISGESR